ncbi:hypothetical protein ABH935_001169 [Catenulispora sp. GAS73]
MGCRVACGVACGAVSRAVRLVCQGAAGVWFTGSFYGFANGLMTSQGDAVRLSEACCAGGRRFSLARPRGGSNQAWRVGGWRCSCARPRGGSNQAWRVGGWRCSCARPRAGPSHCACRRRQSSCVVGTLRPPAGALQRGGDPRDLLDGGGPQLVGFLSAVACVALVSCGRCLWSPGFWVPRRVVAVNGTSPVWRNQAAPLLLWYSLVRLDTTKPARLASPADAARDPEPTPRMVLRTPSPRGRSR